MPCALYDGKFFKTNLLKRSFAPRFKSGGKDSAKQCTFAIAVSIIFVKKN